MTRAQLGQLDRLIWGTLARLVGGIALLQALFLVALLVAQRQRRRAIAGAQLKAPHLTSLAIGGNEVQLYARGDALYCAMLEALEQARETIYCETYIWRDDPLGRQFRAVLARRARAGVCVYLIYDGVGNLLLPRTFFADLPPDIQVLRYRSWPWLLLTRGQREHRKLLVIDQQVAFVGGYNIGAEYRTAWRDTHLRLSGPTAEALAGVFVTFWNAQRSAQLPALPAVPSPPLSQMTIQCSEPARGDDAIRRAYLAAITRARRTIYIANAYFVPDGALLQALVDAAHRGVDVRVLLPWQSNYGPIDWLARHNFSLCLRSGIRIYGYQGAMLHTKTATIDGYWSTVGSANLDRLGLVGNYELNIDIQDRAGAQQMEALFGYDLRWASEITLDEWERRPWYRKAGEWLIAPLWPLM